MFGLTEQIGLLVNINKIKQMANVLVNKIVSTFNDLSKNDLIHAVIVTAVGAAIGAIGTMFEDGGVIPHTMAQFAMIARAAFGAGLSVLVVKFKSGPKQIPTTGYVAEVEVVDKAPEAPTLDPPEETK